MTKPFFPFLYYVPIPIAISKVIDTKKVLTD